MSCCDCSPRTDVLSVMCEWTKEQRGNKFICGHLDSVVFLCELYLRGDLNCADTLNTRNLTRS